MTLDLEAIERLARGASVRAAETRAQTGAPVSASIGVDPDTVLELVRLARVGREAEAVGKDLLLDAAATLLVAGVQDGNKLSKLAGMVK